jgi:hypothetical protein
MSFSLTLLGSGTTSWQPPWVTSIHKTKTTHAGRQHSTPCSLISAMSCLARTSQTREGAQYVFKQIQQNGCLALFQVVDRTMAHTQHTDRSFALHAWWPLRISVSFTPRGSRVSVFFILFMQPPHSLKLFTRETPRVESKKMIGIFVRLCSQVWSHLCTFSVLRGEVILTHQVMLD